MGRVHTHMYVAHLTALTLEYTKNLVPLQNDGPVYENFKVYATLSSSAYAREPLM